MIRIFSGRLVPFLILSLISGQACKTTVTTDGFRKEISNDLRADFLNPPSYARLRTFWWWLNSNVTKECITQDLEAMKANGYGGAIIFDAGSSNYTVAKKTDAGPAFLSDKWMELYGHAIKEADRLGLELTINVQSGWNPGGPSVTPEFAMKKITWSETDLSGPSKINSALPDPTSQLFYKDILVQAVRKFSGDQDSPGIKNHAIKTLLERIGWSGIYPLHKLREDYDTEPLHTLNKGDIIDVTPFYKDGILTWDVPDGEWTIIRYGMTCTGVKVSTSSDGWDGLSMDHLNRNALTRYNEDVISRLIARAKQEGNSLKFIHTDSWEMGVANWTQGFMEKFRELRGYDMTEYMPVITNRIVGNRDISNRFLHDFRRTVSDLIADEFYKTFSEIARQNDLFTHPESGGPHSAPIDAIKTMGYNDVPMGEFWVRSNTHRVSDAQRLCVKQSASVAHVYGKQFVAAEGPTSIGPHWERPPRDCKNVIDRIFCSGVNRIVWHTFTASPDEYGEPGNEYFAGTHLNRHVTWWKESEEFIRYMNRCSFLLSQGKFVADALYYYGDDTPNFIFIKEEVTDLGQGYDWDKCSLDVLLNRVRIKDGKIILPDGMTYRILVLPEEKALNIKLLRKLEKLVHDGLILIGPKPEKSTGLTEYPEVDAAVSEIAEKLWGNIDGNGIKVNKFGKGKVIWGLTPGETLRSVNINPDFSYSSAADSTCLEYIHRSTGKEEIYFVVNRLARHGIYDTQYRYLTDLPDRYEEVVCKFRVTGKIPELWNPMTGEIKQPAVYHDDGYYTYVPLHLNPEGSVFVIFVANSNDKHIIKIVKDGEEIFPAAVRPGSKFPTIECYYTEEGVITTFSQPGNYTLRWSDGTENTTNVKEPLSVIPIDSSINLKFLNQWGPKETIAISEFKSWSDFEDKRIKYYSGPAEYLTVFNLKNGSLAGKKVLIDLGNVQEIAAVWINDEYAGVAWIAPFILDITGFVHEGNNKLTVRVVNSWVNRLIGDGHLPPEKRYTRTNVLKFEGGDKDHLLRKSGLTDDIKLIIIDEKIIGHF
ncbi:MAG TPA: glycosyl hydrolase [Bacteroidales bacterium]|nr:glycosyl hydrolase [Bacteroidales bacterium]